MSWLFRFFTAASLLALAGCGFAPMYGKSTQQALASGVRIEAPRDAMGQKFQQELEDRLNPTGIPANPKYLLKVDLATASSAIGVARDGTVSRFNVILGSRYMLVRLSDNKVVQRDEVSHVASFNNQPNQYFSTYISEKDALRRGVEELAALFYGPDNGLARERSQQLIKAVLGAEYDSLSVLDVTEARLASDPAMLADELSAVSLMADQRVILIRDAGDKLTKILEAADEL